jgi:predicted DCC family thiol-disulfide oxidoreductase YuxK
MRESHPVLLYDARCGVCRRFVRFLVHKDRNGTVRIAPLQSPLGAGIRGRYPEFDKRDSAVWLPAKGRPTGFSEAILDTLAFVGGSWAMLARTARLVPRPLRDGIYRLFARNRRYFGWLSVPELGEEATSRLMPGVTEAETEHELNGRD